MNCEKLTILRDHLRNLDKTPNSPLGFSMHTLLAYEGYSDKSIHNCQTVGCIAGHTYYLFKTNNIPELIATANDIEETATQILNLAHWQATLLFYPHTQWNATPGEAADAIDRLLEGKEPWPRSN